MRNSEGYYERQTLNSLRVLAKQRGFERTYELSKEQIVKGLEFFDESGIVPRYRRKEKILTKKKNGIALLFKILST